MELHLYNETFDYYHEPAVNQQEAQIFLDMNNKAFGGRWVIDNERQYREWKLNHPEKFMDIGIVYNPYIPKVK